MPSPIQDERGAQQLIVYNRPVVQALATFLTSLAILLTIARLIRRFRIRRLSWDDAWAALSMVLMALYLGVYWEGNKTFKTAVENQQPLDLNEYKNRFKAWSLITMGLYTAIVWCSRISLSLSIARILPLSRLRRFTVCLAIFCLLAGVSLPFLKAFLCIGVYDLQSDPTTRPSSVFCPRAAGYYLIAFQIAGDVISTTLLVAIPIYFLRSTDLPTSERRLVLTLFASTVMALAASILHVMFILQGSPGVVFSIHLQTSISLIVCNLVVVVTAAYRLLPCRKSPYDTPETTGLQSHYNTGEDPVTVLTWTQLSARLDSSRDTSLSYDSESRTFELMTARTSGHRRYLRQRSLEQHSVPTELEGTRTNSLRSVDFTISSGTK